jgi:hypothetical protein
MATAEVLSRQPKLASNAVVGVLVKDSEETLPHLTGLLARVNATPDPSLLVVFTNRGGLGVVRGQSLLEGLSIVVRPLDQRLAGYIILHILLGGVEDLVVRTSRGRVDQATRYPCNQQRIINLQLDGVVQLLLAARKHVIQTLCLGNGAREAI